eukprot:TRINITY_DN25659_c0_g1_i1.p1 TRINITY_DN25659_c0_g1~~TRINITY_DN25659_c0_g1_i1.p1  ORF type:complete len:254 (-),score=63.51 TRINITY_DN25659_c0_g1_i1:23-784(-)
MSSADLSEDHLPAFGGGAAEEPPSAEIESSNLVANNSLTDSTNAGDGDEIFFAEASAAVKTIVTIEQEQAEELEDLKSQVKDFIDQLPSEEGGQVLDRLLRRLAAGEPLSARKVSDRVDESCEFLAELLAFCQGGPNALAEVLNGVASAREAPANEEQKMLSHFLKSRRRHRLECLRSWGPWEEHFAGDGTRYFYNNDTQKTQWHEPEGWPDVLEANALCGRTPNAADVFAADAAKAGTFRTREKKKTSAGYQ